jgi:probable F420-dependent oxidoreductase
MRLDLVLPNDGPFMMPAMESGPHFEAMGWDGLWLTDHIVGVEAFAVKHGAQWLDILIAAGHLAARTQRVRIGTGVLVLPYRDPVIAARMVASLDLLSGGRIDLGVGTGWARREFMAVGRGDIFDRRGAYADEVLDVMLTCWKGGPISFQGEFFKIDKVTFAGTPAQGERVPLWIGARGLAPAPMRRAAKYADYWHPTGLTPEQINAGGDRLDEMAGRPVKRTLRVRTDGDPSEMADMLWRYKEAGCVMVACAFNKPQTFSEFDKAATAIYEAAKALQDESAAPRQPSGVVQPVTP